MLCCHYLTTPAPFAGEGDPVLRVMFAARKSIFVDLLKWQVPVIDGRYEVDQFDDQHAQYIVLTDREGSHVASARLLPTLRPHILETLYPQLSRQGVPRAPDAREITRFCLDRSLSRTERRGARDALVHQLARHALAEGIRTYTAVADTSWCAKIRAFGWRCSPLGDQLAIGGKRIAALRIEIDSLTPRLLEEAGIVGPHVEPAPPRRTVSPAGSGTGR